MVGHPTLWFGVLIAILFPILAKAAPVEVRSLLAPKLAGLSTWTAALGTVAGVGAIGYLVVEGLQPVGRAAIAIAVLAVLIRWLAPAPTAEHTGPIELDEQPA